MSKQASTLVYTRDALLAEVDARYVDDSTDVLVMPIRFTTPWGTTEWVYSSVQTMTWLEDELLKEPEGSTMADLVGPVRRAVVGMFLSVPPATLTVDILDTVSYALRRRYDLIDQLAIGYKAVYSAAERLCLAVQQDDLDTALDALGDMFDGMSPLVTRGRAYKDRYRLDELASMIEDDLAAWEDMVARWEQARL